MLIELLLSGGDIGWAHSGSLHAVLSLARSGTSPAAGANIVVQGLLRELNFSRLVWDGGVAGGIVEREQMRIARHVDHTVGDHRRGVNGCAQVRFTDELLLLARRHHDK